MVCAAKARDREDELAMPRHEYLAVPVISLQDLCEQLPRLEADGWNVMGPITYTAYGAVQGAVLLGRVPPQPEVLVSPSDFARARAENPASVSRCRQCKGEGFTIDEYTSPYTGLCAACTAKGDEQANG